MSEQKYLKYCCKCAVSKSGEIPGAKYYVKGYKSFYDSDDIVNCLECGNELISYSMTCEEYNELTHISTDPQFIESMISLKDTDIIEYNLKLSQFKTSLTQQENNIKTDNKPKCPTCGSTDLSKVSTISKAGSVALWGLFSQKVKKTWHCNNCKYEW